MNKSIFSIVAIVLVTCLIFFKIFTKSLFPIPGDLLVSFYYPWYSGGWNGYNPWTTHKELLGADSIRQIYLWKEFAANQLKKGQIPLWNPYTFSGQPLAANFQSSVFYPLNIFYFLTNAKNAWILLIVVQPLLGGVFMYLATRSFKVEQIASLFAAISFMFSSYLITWMENGNIAHSYIWLPLAFWLTNKYFEKENFRFLLILILSLSLSILAGHPQTAIYIYMAVFLFWLFKMYETKVTKFLSLFFIIISSLTLSAIQLIPTYAFYKNSPISLPFSKEVFDRAIMPLQNLVTLFASDFFGHPANNNFWSQTYGDFTPYFGVIPLIFSLWAIYRFWNKLFVKFAAFISLFFIISSIHGPITYLIKTFQIPILDSTTPSRFISISIFFLIVLTGIGLSDFLNNFNKQKFLNKFFKFLTPFAIIYIFLWSFAILGQSVLGPGEVWQTNLAVTRRNLILPSLMFLSLPVTILMIRFIKIKINLNQTLIKNLLVISVFTATVIGGIYYSNKFLPVAPKSFIFPDHPLFTWLNDNAGLYRFYGGGTAHIDFNFPTHYQTFGAEGYDTLRFERYAQLLASSFTGRVPDSYLRSDGVFPNEENGYRKRLFELLGVKYLLDKEDNPKSEADFHYERFPGDKVKGIWQQDKFQILEREPALPRIFQTTRYYLAKDDQEVIQRIYDPNYNLESLLLEEQPSVEIKGDYEIAVPEINKYEPNEITIFTSLDYNSLLFISDAYDPDWKVAIDDQKTKLLRAHYALRAVAVPTGHHQVVFKYEPQSFSTGLKTTLLSAAVLTLISIYFARKKQF